MKTKIFGLALMLSLATMLGACESNSGPAGTTTTPAATPAAGEPADTGTTPASATTAPGATPAATTTPAATPATTPN
ncbi:hypothetical protein [Sphaerospermopsis torques-reginae]|uniref:Beta-Ig-H3/fasciclin n=1 Tax=Sphaerospermopsis torques-reginae ITEP-024 TaxID=984208 RepID=A0ABX8X262_9CYAN|nr:hypothetical protein [Sphaerospermopsis torques-reginae]QYX32720.1 hypothetical protein K2F26_04930 [Sphaerospermopsis torques-reginae ITEP-024]